MCHIARPDSGVYVFSNAPPEMAPGNASLNDPRAMVSLLPA